MDGQDQGSIRQGHRWPFHKRTLMVVCSCLLILGVTLGYLTLGSTQRAHASSGDFNQGTNSVNSSQALFWFQPSGWSAGYVILHYLQPGGAQQNVNMTYNSSTTCWEYTANGMSSGQTITYSFTYQKDGLQYDTDNFSFVFGSSGGGTPSPTPAPPPPGGGGSPGTFPLTFQNNTHGTWANNQIYVLALGQTSPNQWFYLKADGSLAHINHQDADAPGHLTKNGVNYANMSFSLDQASTVTMPAHLDGARLYISVGSPLYIPIAPDDSGWGGPNPNNPSDPNIDVYFDWYEFTYQYGQTPFGGNTTQVDQFGLPLTARLQQTATGYDQTIGITLTRDQVFSQYAASVGPAFQSLASPYRIVAPHTSPSFSPGGYQGNYMQAYIDQVWNYYSSNPFTLTRLGTTFSGGVVNGQLQFTRNGAGPFFLGKPTTADVLACSGPLSDGATTTEAKELGADVCAAFNRGVALNTADWYNPAAYYRNSVHNDYAGFWHQVGIDHRAYGFPYDDVNDQSTFKSLSNTDPPSNLTIGIGW